MRIYFLENGHLECDSNQIVAMSTVGTLNNPTPLHKWIKVPVYQVLIDHPQAKILFDTGCHPDAMNGYWPEGLKQIFPYYYEEEHRIENQLSKIGLSPKDVDIVVQSHMHLDHSGNLGLFIHAPVYVSKQDFMSGLVATHTNPDPATHGAYIKAEIELPCNFQLVDEDFELLPGIKIILLPGHTAGVLGLVLKLEKSGTLIFTSDAVYTAQNYGPPARFSGLVYDSLAFMNSIEKVRKIAKKENAKVIFGHDWDLYQTLKKAPEYYD